jgi:hypothetical protein
LTLIVSVHPKWEERFEYWDVAGCAKRKRPTEARGAYFRGTSGWTFVPYTEIEDVIFPEKSDTQGALTLRTSRGNFDLLSGRPELWTVGHYFMRCADDAKT